MTLRGSRTECPREGEVLDLVAIGQWPARAEADLVAHVGSCRSCSSLAVAATAVAELRDAGTPTVPDAAIVWHRAQVRARRESAVRALAPMNAVVGIAGAALVGLAGGWWATGSAYARAAWELLSAQGQEVAATLGTTGDAAIRAVESGAGLTEGLAPILAVGLGIGVLVVVLALLVGKAADH